MWKDGKGCAVRGNRQNPSSCYLKTEHVHRSPIRVEYLAHTHTSHLLLFHVKCPSSHVVHAKRITNNVLFDPNKAYKTYANMPYNVRLNGPQPNSSIIRLPLCVLSISEVPGAKHFSSETDENTQLETFGCVLGISMQQNLYNNPDRTTQQLEHSG